MFWNTTPHRNKQLLKIYKISWRHVQEMFQFISNYTANLKSRKKSVSIAVKLSCEDQSKRTYRRTHNGKCVIINSHNALIAANSLQTVKPFFSAAVANLRKATVSFVMCLRPSVRPPVCLHGTTQLTPDRFLQNYVLELLLNIPRIFKFVKTEEK